MSSQIPLRKYGVSKYPPATPFIGQSNVHDKLQTFLSDTEDDGPGNYFIFGDWGAGKSRIGHQIVAEVTGQKNSWWIAENGDFVDRPILQEVEPTVFPIKLPLSDFIKDIDADTAALIAFNRGVERLIDSEDPVYDALREELASRGVEVMDLRQIKESGKTPTEKMKAYQDIFYDSDKIDRLVLIIDEVEDIDRVAEQSPGELGGEGVSRARLRVFLQGLKRMVNPEHELYDGAFNVSLLLLCTLNIQDEMAEIGGFNRRNYSVKIERPKVTEAVHLMDRLRQQYDEIRFSDDCAKALFFAAYNNYGWFFSTLYLLLVHQDPDGSEREYDEIMRSSPGAFDTLFNQSVTEDIDRHAEVPETVREEILEIVYRLSPTPVADIQGDSAELAAYEDPSLTRPVGCLTPVDLSLSELKKRMIADYGFSQTSNEDERLLVYQGDQIEVQTLNDALTVFQTADGELLLYQDETDLEELAKFVSKGDLAEDTAEQIVQFLTDIQSGEPSYIGPTIQFLTNWSNRWQTQDEILQWLRDADKWTALNQAVRDIQGRGDEEVLRGFLYTRFEHLRDDNTNISARSDLTFPNFEFDAEADNLASAAPSDTGIGLIYAGEGQSTADLKSDVREIRREFSDWPLVHLIFRSDDERGQVMETLSQTFPHFSKFIFPHTVDQIAGDAKFYKRFSFLNREYDEETVFTFDDLNSFGRERLRGKLEKIRSTDVDKLDQLRDEGWFLKPILPSHLQLDADEYLVKGINHFAGGAKELQDGTFTGTESERIGRVWDKYREDQEELLTLVTDENKLQVPPEITRILWIIERASGEMTATALAGQMVYDSDYRADVRKVAKNILKVLAGIGAVAPKNNGYVLCDESYLSERITETTKKLSTQRGNKDERLGEIENVLLNHVLGYFNVRGPQLDVYKKELEGAENDITVHSFGQLTAQNPGQDWYETTQFALETLRLCKRGYDPDNEFTSGGPQPATEIPEDSNFNKYSRCYRIAYLHWLQEAVTTFEQSITQEIDNRREKLEKTYKECHEEPFPRQVIADLLDNMETDIKREEVKLKDELTDPTDNSFYGHLQVPQLKAVFQRMTWYSDSLVDRVRDDDPWSRYVAAYSKMEDALVQWPDVKDTKTKVEAFLEDSGFEDDLLEAELSPDESPISDSISGQWEPLAAICTKPKDELQSADLDELEQMVGMVLVWLPEIEAHCEDVRQAALEDLDEQRESLPYDELEQLCMSVSVTPEVNLTEIDNQDRYIDREAKVEDLEEEINAQGKEILDSEVTGGNKLWEFYKRLYHDVRAENPITSRTYNDEEQQRLDRLAKSGIIDKNEITHYDIRL